LSLYLTEGDMIQAAGALAQWSASESAERVEESPGNS
jgi:hypothetical protein